jgi:hypothetical protein
MLSSSPTTSPTFHPTAKVLYICSSPGHTTMYTFFVSSQTDCMSMCALCWSSTQGVRSRCCEA